MTNTMKRKVAYNKLDKVFTRKYINLVIYKVVLGLLESLALLVTFFLVANKINSHAIYGGPSSFLRVAGILVALLFFAFTLSEIPDIKTNLKKQYRKAKMKIAMKFS